MKKILLIIILIANLNIDSIAWVYPEHRDIALLAILKLDSGHRATLDQLWAQARHGYESRLNVAVVDPAQSADMKFLDFAAWPAIAGDHSTSSENMVNNILHTDWIMDVANVAANLKIGIANSRNRSERISKLRDSDIRLLRVDPDYVSRAGSNNVHFMLARPDVKTSVLSYFMTCVKEGTELNLVGTYLWYHASALLKAQRLSQEVLTPDQRSSLALAALADEAFALHFLEDGFASGHVAGIWGTAALRKGTHDYYNENGLEVSTWQGDHIVITGDAYMRPEDAERASNSVLLSLVQLLEAASRKDAPFKFNDQMSVLSPDTFNIAKSNYMPYRMNDPAFRELYNTVLLTTPVPGLAMGLGEIPRFRSELGPFIGIAPSARISAMSGGFGLDQKTIGVIPGLEVALHVGLGLDGVLNEAGDGLIFLDLGWRLDGPSTMKIRHDPAYDQFGSILSAIPTRNAFYFRFRMPYYVIPGDLLVAGPIMYLISERNFEKMMATAVQGGLIPWQTGMVTPIGRFQFILGREIGVCFYGSLLGADSYLIPDESLGEGELSLISMHSTQIEFPILEYRPVRTFSRRQSMSFVVQINAGLDIPGKVTMIEPTNAPVEKLKTIWFMGVRVYFDWRYYIAKNK